MRTTVGELRAMLFEAELYNGDVVNPETGELYEVGWLYDAWLEFAELWRDDEAAPNAFTHWLEQHGIPHLQANYIGQVLNDESDKQAFFDEGSQPWSDLLNALSNAYRIHRRVPLSRTQRAKAPKHHRKRRHTVKVVVGRWPDGSFMERGVNVNVGFDGTITGAKGEPIWAYDPDTLELSHVPTYIDAKEMERGNELNLKLAFLKDIEAGVV